MQLIILLFVSLNALYISKARPRRCSADAFGWDCQFSCQCENPNEVCNELDGSCPASGCRTGWWGRGCQLSDSCYYDGSTFGWKYAGHLQKGRYGTRSALCFVWSSAHLPLVAGWVKRSRYFPPGGIQASMNYCRNPAGPRGGELLFFKPWCYNSSCDATCQSGPEPIGNNAGPLREIYCDNLNHCPECPVALFSPEENCQKECHCQGTNCSQSQGLCSNVAQCSPGWTDHPQCQTECPDGKFGLGCAENCNCLNRTEVCHKYDGFCHSECPPGWTGTACNRACPVGWFGNNCSGVCRCADNSNCNKINGSCLTGCLDGWDGEACQTRITTTTIKPTTTEPLTSTIQPWTTTVEKSSTAAASTTTITSVLLTLPETTTEKQETTTLQPTSTEAPTTVPESTTLPTTQAPSTTAAERQTNATTKVPSTTVATSTSIKSTLATTPPGTTKKTPEASFVYCPANITASVRSGDLRLYIPKPVVANGKLVREPKQRWTFPIGKTVLSYVARNPTGSGKEITCNVIVTVKKALSSAEHCEDLGIVYGGEFQCEDARQQKCNVTCVGKFRATVKNLSYVCHDRQWKPAFDEKLRSTACVLPTPPTTYLVEYKMRAKIQNQCRAVPGFREIVSRQFVKLLNESNMCPRFRRPSVRHATLCKANRKHIEVDCAAKNAKQQYFFLDLTLLVNLENATGDEKGQVMSFRAELLAFLRAGIRLRLPSLNLTTTSNVSLSAWKEKIEKCEAGHGRIGDFCALCNPGSYLHEGRTCKSCRPGYYQPHMGKSACLNCGLFKSSNYGSFIEEQCSFEAPQWLIGTVAALGAVLLVALAIFVVLTIYRRRLQIYREKEGRLGAKFGSATEKGNEKDFKVLDGSTDMLNNNWNHVATVSTFLDEKPPKQLELVTSFKPEMIGKNNEVDDKLSGKKIHRELVPEHNNLEHDATSPWTGRDKWEVELCNGKESSNNEYGLVDRGDHAGLNNEAYESEPESWQESEESFQSDFWENVILREGRERKKVYWDYGSSDGHSVLQL